jgi:hypothetical protein
MDARFESPEAAALAGWSDTPTAGARVAHVTVRGQRAEVVVDVAPAYREWVYCVHGSDGWRAAVSGNGPTPNWDDPDAYNWDP